MQALSVYFGQKALEMVLEEACEVLREALPDATLTPLREGQLGAFLHIFLEDMSLLQGDVAICEDCRYLVGKAQASRVDVGASDGGQSVVHDDGLGVHVAAFVKVDLYALAQE